MRVIHKQVIDALDHQKNLNTKRDHIQWHEFSDENLVINKVVTYTLWNSRMLTWNITTGKREITYPKNFPTKLTNDRFRLLCCYFNKKESV